MINDIDKINIIFEDWKSLCKYYHPAFEDYSLTDSCRHEGECKKDKCPFLNKKGDMND